MTNEFTNKIKSIFSNKLKSPSTLMKAIKECDKSIINDLNNILKNIPEYEKISYLIISICKDIKLKKCKNCGKTLNYSKNSHDFCSGKCAQQSDEVKLKSENTLFKKYGVKHPTESKEILKRRDENNIKKYGTSNLRNVESINEKIRNTNLKKYNAITPSKNNDVKEKIKKTCLEKYGVEFSGASKIKIEKTKMTFMEKYGCHPMQSEDIKQNVIKHNREKYFTSLIEKCKKFNLTPLFTLDEYIGGYRIDKKYKCHCNKCNADFESYIELVKISSDHVEYIPRCPNCYPMNPNVSLGEKELLNFISSLLPNDKIIENDRTILNGKELDILIPSKNIAFEFNGIYWHSYEINNNKNYHQEKTIECFKKGIRLIHIFEYDWLMKQNIIKEKIKNILVLENESIYARKCKVKEIDSKTKNDFLNKYHIQGEDKSIYSFGLFDENDLVAVMTFGKSRFNKNYEWELIRYATSKHVIGGAGKLLSYFEKMYNPKSMITYADYGFSNGNMYKKLGFTEKCLTSPSYVYTKNGNVYSRFQCQKHKLKKLLSDKYDDSLSEYENMKKAGFVKIFNCGNLVFVK